MAVPSATSLTHHGRFVARRKLSRVSCRRIVIGMTDVPSARASSSCARAANRSSSGAVIGDERGTIALMPLIGTAGATVGDEAAVTTAAGDGVVTGDGKVSLCGPIADTEVRSSPG